jgi:hypothetical protein
VSEPAFLTAAEVEQLTQRRRYSAQRRALDAMQVRYARAPNGQPIVRRTALDVAGKPAHRPASGPRWDRIASVKNLRP